MAVSESAGFTTESYNRYSRWLHWLIAGLILFMVFLGWRLGDHDSMRLDRAQLHKSVGILILILSLIRIAVRLAYKAPPEPPMPAWQAMAAKTLHIGFYVVMIAMPLTGWLMVSTSLRDIPVLGPIPSPLHWPHLPFVPIEQGHGPTHEFFETVHGLIAKLIIYGMVPLHVLAALKHQFVDKDTVVQHMVPGLTPKPILNWRWIVPLGVVLLAVGLANGIYRGVPETEAPPSGASSAGAVAPGAAPAGTSASASTASAATSSAAVGSSSSTASTTAVTAWTIDPANTQITFATSFQGEAIKGGFAGKAAQIAFDPAQLDKSHVKVTIDLTSVASGDSDRDSTLKGNDFFNTASTPKAVFEATSFTKSDATHFVARGKLTLRGVTKPCTLPFTLVIKNGVADMTAAIDIDRTAYGVGGGDYAATDVLPAKVAVTIKLKATAVK